MFNITTSGVFDQSTFVQKWLVALMIFEPGKYSKVDGGPRAVPQKRYETLSSTGFHEST